MTQHDVYECDGCGDRHGHKTEMLEVPLVKESDLFEEPDRMVAHLCTGCATSQIAALRTKFAAVGVNSFRGEATAAVKEDGTYFARADMTDGKPFEWTHTALKQVEERVL